MLEVLRIGTRRSRLSRWQAGHVADLLRKNQPRLRVEIRHISTRGDEAPDAPLPAIGAKGVFTESLEIALLRGEIDCAVHSLKDLPVEQTSGLSVIVPARGDPRDALVSRNGAKLAELPPGARIGTGSLRRGAQLLALRPDLRILPLRGNVPTRLEKLRAPDNDYDAIVLAAAGLQRLGLMAQVSEIFEPERLVSAAGQGALAIQCRDAGAASALLAALVDQPSALATAAERAFLHALAGGCAMPVGAYARFDGGALQLHGRVTALDGARLINVRGAATTPSGPAAAQAARKLGLRLAAQALNQGARQLLDEIAADDQPGIAP